VAKIAKESGYVSAVTDCEGLNAPGHDVFALLRISFPGSGGTAPTLAAVSGLSETVARAFAVLRRSPRRLDGGEIVPEV
jgi:hypothetical protein